MNLLRAVQADDQIERARDAVYERLDLQLEFPDKIAPAAAADRLEPELMIAYAALWVTVAVVVLTLTALLVRRIRNGSAREETRSDPKSRTPDAAEPATIDLSEVDALVEKGELGEALHLLLLKAIERMDQWRDRSLPASATGRELLEQAELSSAARAALSGLVKAVEPCLFGGLPASETEVADGRSRLQEFGAALVGDSR